MYGHGPGYPFEQVVEIRSNNPRSASGAVAAGYATMPATGVSVLKRSRRLSHRPGSPTTMVMLLVMVAALSAAQAQPTSGNRSVAIPVEFSKIPI